MKTDVMWRGVYGCFVDKKLVYVGSSTCGITKLAENHRNWKEKYGESGRTLFRSQLTENPSMMDNEFLWLVPPHRCTQRQIETIEGRVIRALNPKLNVDKDPVKSSIKYGRYNDESVGESDMGYFSEGGSTLLSSRSQGSSS